ncbi:hypothetical protein [Devosia sp. Naph2]|uniref:hypothetical protein n=1 Tax=Devosia polycyclovorans TaxID=3345148 RepID=UPI0035D0F372
MAIKSLKVLVRFTFPDETVTRLHDGAGPFLDTNGDLWLGACLTEGLDEIEMAMNGEAATLMLGVSGLAPDGAGLAFDEMEDGNVIGGKVQLLLQGMDAWDQPTGAPEVKFTGTIDNMPMADTSTEDGTISSITLEITNRFSVRRLTSGAVLSDVDQRARSAQLNPSAPSDKFAERIPGLSDKAIRWPRFS